MNNNKAWDRSFFILILLSLFLLLLSSLLPYFFLIYPAPLILIFSYYGWKRGLGVLAINMAVAFFLSKAILVQMMFFSVPIVLMLSWGILTKQPPMKTLLIAATVGMLGTCLLFFALDQGWNINLIAEMKQITFNMLKETFQEAGVLNTTAGFSEAMLQTRVNQALSVFFAGLFGYFLFLSFINYFIVIRNIRKKNPLQYMMLGMPDFSVLQLPQTIFIGVAVALGTIIFMDLMNVGKATEFAMNIYYVFAFLFALQGLSVIEFFLKPKMKPVLRWILYVFIIVLQMGFLLSILGIIDMLMNLRLRKLR